MDAGSTHANYQVGRSGLPQAGRDFALDKFSLSCGQIITGGVTFSVGRKDVPIHVSRAGYVEKLRWIDQKQVVFWDVGDKRGWMLNGSAALHHLLRGSLEHSRTDRFRSRFLFDFSELKDGDAIDVLLDPEHRRLRLYPSGEDTHTESIVGADGSNTGIQTKTRTTYTTLGNRIDELYSYLERMIEHKSHIENTKGGVNAKIQLRRHLEGWDFRDIVSNRDPSHLRVATLPTQAFSWVELTRLAQAVTLFGRSFGELLVPAAGSTKAGCSHWKTVPKGNHYLCASLCDMRNIIEDNEGSLTGDPIIVGPGLAWMNPSKNNPFEPCLCETTNGTTLPSSLGLQSPVQQLVPTSWRRVMTGSPLKLDGITDGAVIFGHSNGFQWTLWPDGNQTKDPEQKQSMASPSATPTTSGYEGGSSTSQTTPSSLMGSSHPTPDTPMSSVSTREGAGYLSVQAASPKPPETPSRQSSPASESAEHDVKTPADSVGAVASANNEDQAEIPVLEAFKSNNLEMRKKKGVFHRVFGWMFS